jgi:hypothetical protein
LLIFKKVLTLPIEHTFMKIRITKRFKRYFMVLCGIIAALFFIVWCLIKTVQPTITTGKFFYGKNSTIILIGKENIIWDTGAVETIFFQDFAAHQNKICCISPAIVFDSKRDWSVTSFYFSREVELSPFTIKNIFYLIETKESISPFMKKRGFGGVLGMDIISQANWVIDFSEGSIQIPSEKDTILFNQKPGLMLSYKKTVRPKAPLTIQGVEIEDLLIDSGSESGLVLCESDIKKINQYIQPVDTSNYESSGLYSQNKHIEVQYTYKDMNINGYDFDMLNIVQGTRRKIGMGFFRKFDKVYLNTQEKTFRFYLN